MDDKNQDTNNNDKNHTKRLPVHRDGVSYIPDDDLALTRKIMAAPPRNIPQSTVKKLKKEPKRVHYAVFLVTTVFVGVLAAVYVFSMMLSEMLGGENTPLPSNEQQTAQTDPPLATQQPQTEIPQDPNTQRITGLIQDININSRRIDIYVFDNSQMRSFFAEGHSVMRNKFGSAISLAELNPGNVVEINYRENSTVIESIRISAQVDTYSNINGVIVDLENEIFLIGSERYSFDPFTVVRYHGTNVPLESLDPIDVVSLDIFQNRVVFVDIHKGNGIIRVPSNNQIIQGRLEVIPFIIMDLGDEDIDVRAAEGIQSVLINGANIYSFETKVDVPRGGVVTLDFEGLVVRAGSLTVFSEDTQVTLTIDNQTHPINQPIILDYGDYNISVTRDGFVPFVQDITILEANHELTVSLEEVINTSNIIITTAPLGARVYLDGEYQGMSPVSLNLEHRRYTLTFAMEGFETGSQDIWVTEETTSPQSFGLIPIVWPPDPWP